MPTWLHPPSWATSLGWVFLAQGLFYFPLLTLNMFLLLCVSFLILVKLPLQGALISRIPTTAFTGSQATRKFSCFQQLAEGVEQLFILFFKLSPDFYSYIQKILSTYLFLLSLNVFSENDRNLSCISLLNFINLVSKQENNI